jgi:hypothetical protein
MLVIMIHVDACDTDECDRARCGDSGRRNSVVQSEQHSEVERRECRIATKGNKDQKAGTKDKQNPD